MIVITAWFAVLFFGFVMCRLSALSDESYDAEVAEWIEASSVAGANHASAGPGSGAPISLHVPQDHYRATG